jgi:hypothetical protein
MPIVHPHAWSHDLENGARQFGLSELMAAKKRCSSSLFMGRVADPRAKGVTARPCAPSVRKASRTAIFWRRLRVMSPFRSLRDYEQFVYTLQAAYPAISHSRREPFHASA